jgi:hypothetical protein
MEAVMKISERLPFSIVIAAFLVAVFISIYFGP